ncbi:acid phosphatase [Vibrio jasicida]|uniref:acid phosphatase n=1 Tax=Vibrio jasicida TaxID=766224 RepID=UPI00390A478C
MKKALICVALTLPAFHVFSAPTDINSLERIDYGNYQFYQPYIETVHTVDLIAPPPTEGSKQDIEDKRVGAIDFSVDDPARMAQATQDARITPEYFAKIYGDVLGVKITKEDTPAMYTVLGRSIASFGLATSDSKKHYNKARPFAVNGLPSCTPYAEGYLSKDGSYPSGHTASGYGVSLVAAAIAPHNAKALTERGADYGYSRVVCNAHWMSDVEAGQKVAHIVFDKLKADKQFAEDLQAAQQEYVALTQ